jgi:hypothetical protein
MFTSSNLPSKAWQVYVWMPKPIHTKLITYQWTQRTIVNNS